MQSEDPKDKILDAALAHVPFDGWSEATLAAAAQDAGMDVAAARALFPRGPVDLALAFHRRGDAELKRQLASADQSDMRFRDRVAQAVRMRLEIAGDREAVRRGVTLFALPQHAAGRGKGDVGYLGCHLDGAGRYGGRRELVHEAGVAVGGVWRNGAVLAGR